MRWLAVLIPFLWGSSLIAGEVTVAVASNFIKTAEELVEAFEQETGHQVTLVHGSTGQLFSQISNGAPFDIFLAADQERPGLAVENGLANEARSYALGRLALVSRMPINADTASNTFAGETVALADPTVAPYGLAATRAMERLALDTATFRPVLVANVGQVATLFATGNANFAFVSETQVRLLDPDHWLSLEGLHPEIRQDAAFLNRAEGKEAANAFWYMLFSETGRKIISANSYDLP